MWFGFMLVLRSMWMVDSSLCLVVGMSVVLLKWFVLVRFVLCLRVSCRILLCLWVLVYR